MHGGHVREKGRPPPAMSGTRPPNLEEMTHAALCAVCEPNAWELQIERIGCASTLVVATILGALAVYLAWATGSVIESLAAGFAVFVGCCVALTFVLFHLARRRRAPLRAELWRRLLQPFAIEEARAAVRGKDPPDWVLVQTTKSFPHGPETFSRLDVWGRPLRCRRNAVAAIRTSRSRCARARSTARRTKGVGAHGRRKAREPPRRIRASAGGGSHAVDGHRRIELLARDREEGSVLGEGDICQSGLVGDEPRDAVRG